MPNWVINKVTITGFPDYVNQLVEDMTENDKIVFSFESVLPTPQDMLNARSPSRLIDLFEYCYLNGLKLRRNMLSKNIFFDSSALMEISINMKELDSSEGLRPIYDKMCAKNINIDWIELYSKLRDRIKYNADIENGKNLYSNIIKYGACDWYDWRIANWGTKWDVSYASDPIYDKENGKVYVEFKTAWSIPDEFYKFIANKYNIVVKGSFADEDVGGGNCGTFTFTMPACSVNYIDDYKQALMFAMEMWNYSNEEMEEILKNEV